MTTYHEMNRLAVELETARREFALTPSVFTDDKAERAGQVVELTHRVRAAERAVMAQALDLAECIPQDGHNYRVVRELILNLQALVHVEETIL